MKWWQRPAANEVLLTHCSQDAARPLGWAGTRTKTLGAMQTWASFPDLLEAEGTCTPRVPLLQQLAGWEETLLLCMFPSHQQEEVGACIFPLAIWEISLPAWDGECSELLVSRQCN